MDKGEGQKVVQRVKTLKMWMRRARCASECQGEVLILMMYGEVLNLFFHGGTHD